MFKSTRSSDPDLDRMLLGAVGVVEATSFEKSCLWRDYQRKPEIQWVDDLSGIGRTIGHIGNMPVFMSLQSSRIDGFKIIFYEITSIVADSRMIDEWFDAVLPPTARKGNCINQTNAMNFHSVFPRYCRINLWLK